jgi:hypothetical protein
MGLVTAFKKTWYNDRPVTSRNGKTGVGWSAVGCQSMHLSMNRLKSRISGFCVQISIRRSGWSCRRA